MEHGYSIGFLAGFIRVRVNTNTNLKSVIGEEVVSVSSAGNSVVDDPLQAE